MPYAPSPNIPPGMSPAAWATVTDAAAKEAAHLAGLVQSGKPLPRDVQTRIAMLGRTIGDLSALTNDARAIADYCLDEHFGPQLQASLDALTTHMPSHAVAAAGDSSAYMAGNGYVGGVSPDVLQAVAQRTNQAMTADWSRLTAGTQATLREHVARGMVAGLNPREVARRVSREVTDAGGMTFARALLIARTEMGDCNDAAVMAGMTGVDGVIGWTFDAQADACATCQVMHGLVYAVDDLPQRHHNCRCAPVPVFDDEGAGVGDYLPGQQRPREEVESRLPKNWQPLPDDLRTMLDLRDNPGWRRSRTLRKPPEAKAREPLKQEPGPPLPRPPLRDITPKRQTFDEFLKDRASNFRQDGDYQRRMIANADEYIEVLESSIAKAKYRLEYAESTGQATLADLHRKDLKKDLDSLRYWQSERRKQQTDLKSIERYGLYPDEVKRMRETWKVEKPRPTFTNGAVVFTADPAHATTTKAAREAAQNTYDALFDALDSLPINLRDRFNLSKTTVWISEYSPKPGSQAGAWAYTGREQSPHIGVSFDVYHTRPVFHPKNVIEGLFTDGRSNYDSNRVSTLVHESGHVFDRLTAAESDDLYKTVQAMTGDDIKGQVSEYGATNGREMVAEAFVDYVSGHDTPLIRFLAERLGWNK